MRYFLLLLLMPTVALADINDCLTRAYPDIKAVNNDTVIFYDGRTLPLGKVSSDTFTKTLNNATIADQLSQRYPLVFNPPKQYADAGRLRNESFFKALYGDNKRTIEKNLVNVDWKPANSRIKFNKNNNAAAQLQKVGDEIAQNPALIPYVAKSLGSFNYRNIAGTKRLSSHSFGVAVDFQLPKALHKYWRWDGCKSEDVLCPYPKALVQDQKLQQVVAIFEKHGFIWGGKWASYDSPHFEYRPELVIPACR